MPRFSETEKELIKSNMMQEAHQLFIHKGLKNTSLEELTSAVSVAKSSFYVFFESKEQLYLDLLVREGEAIEQEVWPKVSREEGLREAIIVYLREMSFALDTHILTRRLITKLEEYQLVSRKLNAAYSATENLRSIVPLIEFIQKYKELDQLIDEEVDVIAAVFRACLTMVIHRKDVGEEVYPRVQDILFSAVANELVK